MIGLHQLSCKNPKSTSWFTYCAKRLSIYDLDTYEIILGNLRSSTIKTAILNHWNYKLRDEASSKSSLKYLYIDACNIQHPHPVWQTLMCNPVETRQSIQKVRLLCGTFILQSSKAAFNQFQVDPTCPLCGTEPEDRIHLILRCPSLVDIRAKYTVELSKLCPEFTDFKDEDKVKTLLDSNYLKTRGIGCEIADLEAISRIFIYSTTCKRTRLLNEKEGGFKKLNYEVGFEGIFET